MPSVVLSTLYTLPQTFLTVLENRKKSKKQHKVSNVYFFSRNSYCLLSTQLCLFQQLKNLSLDQIHSQGHIGLDPEHSGKQARGFNRKWRVVESPALNPNSSTSPEQHWACPLISLSFHFLISEVEVIRATLEATVGTK